MRHRRKSRQRLQGQINVVPYIDVMLVLLVIFMVTAPLIAQSVIDLPTAGDIAPKQKQDAIEIQLPEDGTYTIKDFNFDGEELTFSALDDAILLINERRILFPQAPVLISANRNLAYEKVISVLSRMQQEGLNNIGLVTRTQQ